MSTWGMAWPPAGILLDLRVSKKFRLGDDHSLEVLVDVLNALDHTAEDSVVTCNYFRENFAAGQDFITPEGR